MSLLLNMMPHCFGILLSKMPAEERKTYLNQMLNAILEAGCAEISDKEKEDCMLEMISKMPQPEK
ncbi:MAG: hypothetical protein GWM98_23665, partial [Nitrospinaceae bacterium]|nr:hypothetical protein [Nitrospinaceae bacterium]NIR56906.1 hypothetical protein [Nitrospinaceae bacterium]NIS87368.1 hypothetical protein [Nitrospinaceae bacterium]NIT84223.1 hypothetical protein [Nitrospinaceae bacterium]NIU46408.1 hypothetical protein [Nitrospinaceae bacterium]